MGLVVERHPADAAYSNKIIVKLDKKEKHKLGICEKVDIPLTAGKHTLSFSYSFIKESIEIDYPCDSYLLVAYVVTDKPKICVQSVASDHIEIIDHKPCIPACMNGMCGTLFVHDNGIKFQGMDTQSVELKIDDIREVSTIMGNLSLLAYTGEKYAFVIPQEKFREIMDFLKSRVDSSNQKMQEGFNLSFGIDGKIEINEVKEEFHIRSGTWVSANYKLAQIISYESSEASKKADYLGGALAGNLLGGAGGAVLGTLHAAGQSSKVEYVRMNLTVRTDKGIEALWVNLGDPVFAVERGGSKYAMYAAECSRFVAYMDDWKSRKAAQSTSEHNIDVEAELRKFKALLDDGIIYEADFKAKKKQLLDI